MLIAFLALSITFVSCNSDDDNTPIVIEEDDTDDDGTVDFVDAVYAMINGEGQVEGNVQGPNTIIAYGRSDNGQFLYQLYALDRTIGIYRINGQSLELISEESNNLPDTNTQGIVAI